MIYLEFVFAVVKKAKKFILNFNIQKVFPSYFVVYVGIAIFSVIAPVFNATWLGQIFFWFGFIAYLILLPIIIYRVLAIKTIDGFLVKTSLEVPLFKYLIPVEELLSTVFVIYVLVRYIGFLFLQDMNVKPQNLLSSRITIPLPILYHIL